MITHGTHAWRQQIQPPAALPPPVGWVSSAVPPVHTCTAAQTPAHAVHTSATRLAVLHLYCLVAASVCKLVLELAGVVEGLAGHQAVSQQPQPS